MFHEDLARFAYRRLNIHAVIIAGSHEAVGDSYKAVL